MFWKVFLKLRGFYQPYTNMGEKTILFGRSNNFTLSGWQPRYSTLFVIFIPSYYGEVITLKIYCF
jgi:hypothetical protein